MPNGINPCTFRGTDIGSGEAVNLTIHRLHMRVPKSQGVVEGGQRRIDPMAFDMANEKRVSILVWNGDDENPNILAKFALDEEHFVTGLKHLFIRGELES